VRRAVITLLSQFSRRMAQNQFMRFLTVGGIATGVQFALLILFVELGLLPKVAASAVAYGMATIVNYLLNYYLTFASTKRHREAFSKFVVVVAIGLSVNTLSFWVLLNLINFYLFAQVGATLITLLVNFLLHKHWIYRIN
jgi:putative flippase GtrA